MGGARKIESGAAQFRLRRAVLADLASLVRLEESFADADRFSRRQWRRLLAGNAIVLLLEVGGEAAGAAAILFRKGARAARLYSLVVAPRFRGQGAAARLLAEAEALAARRGCDRLRLEVRQDNRAAITLYSKHGYAEADLLPGYYPDGAAGLRLQKSIAP